MHSSDRSCGARATQSMPIISTICRRSDDADFAHGLFLKCLQPIRRAIMLIEYIAFGRQPGKGGTTAIERKCAATMATALSCGHMLVIIVQRQRAMDYNNMHRNCNLNLNALALLPVLPPDQTLPAGAHGLDGAHSQSETRTDRRWMTVEMR